MGRLTTLAEDQAMYDKRDANIAKLERKKSPITPNDLRCFERTGKYLVIERFWNRLTEDAKTALLCDEHPHIRSTARIAALK